MAELVILIGLPGAGKSSFYRDRFAATHMQVSKDLMRNRRDRQARQLALIDEALDAGRSVVVTTSTRPPPIAPRSSTQPGDGMLP